VLLGGHVNRQTGEATTDLWDDDDTAWQRCTEIERENPLLFSTVVRRRGGSKPSYNRSFYGQTVLRLTLVGCRRARKGPNNQ
jgi:hypothetical protein